MIEMQLLLLAQISFETQLARRDDFWGRGRIWLVWFSLALTSFLISPLLPLSVCALNRAQCTRKINSKVESENNADICVVGDSTSELCLSLNTSPFCINPSTYNFRAEDGTGNLESGDYTLDNGTKGNLYTSSSSTDTSPSPSSSGTPGNGGSGSGAGSGSENSGNGAAKTSTPAGATAAGGANSAAPTTAASGSGGSTSDAGIVRVGGLVLGAALGVALML